MNRVISVNLSGNAYNLEEEAYEALQAYLRQAESNLAKDPGKTEILSDLEQVAAEKCGRYISSSKNVITRQEMESILKEMGPVQSSSEETGKQESAETETKPKAAVSHKKLYRIRKGGIIGGVCNGLAAYFDIDPNLVRLLFIALLIFSGGIWLFVYLFLIWKVPSARTDEEIAAAYGEPFTAQEWISRARQERSSDSHDWKQFKREMRQKLREERWKYKRVSYTSHSGPFWLLAALLSIVWFLGLLSIIAGGSIFGLAMFSMPKWAMLAVWIGLYVLLVSPLKSFGYTVHVSNGDAHVAVNRRRSGIGSLLFLTLIVWGAWHFIPSTHKYFEKVNGWSASAIEAVKS